MSQILVFDSGVGGLSVTADIRRHLPDLAIDYVADDAFRPYGDKTAEQLNQRLPGLLSVLVDMLGSDLVVLACNTASTASLPIIRAALDVPVVGVVPAIKPAAAQSRTRHIGVLGTPGTVKRSYVDQLITDYAQGVKVSLRGSVALVDMAEKKLIGEAVDMKLLSRELAPLMAQTPAIDKIVMACTHFPLLESEISQLVGNRVTLIDSGQAIARRVESLLSERGLALELPMGRNLAFTTGNDISLERQAIFSAYGFTRLLSLKA